MVDHICTRSLSGGFSVIAMGYAARELGWGGGMRAVYAGRT